MDEYSLMIASSSLHLFSSINSGTKGRYSTSNRASKKNKTITWPYFNEISADQAFYHSYVENRALNVRYFVHQTEIN
nr:MAG TPA: hypothetical protein [Caudoviricetes sp.]